MKSTHVGLTGLCLVVSAALAAETSGVTYAVDPVTSGDMPSEAVHESIRIEDNFFDGGGVSARNVKGLTVVNSRSVGKSLSVSTQACSAVKVENNKEQK